MASTFKTRRNGQPADLRIQVAAIIAAGAFAVLVLVYAAFG